MCVHGIVITFSGSYFANIYHKLFIIYYFVSCFNCVLINEVDAAVVVVVVFLYVCMLESELVSLRMRWFYFLISKEKQCDEMALRLLILCNDMKIQSD